MKISDLSNKAAFAASATSDDQCAGTEHGAARNTSYPELGFLLNARTANTLMSCRLLARDEIEVANLVLNQMDVDPHYEPSMTLLVAVRSINATLALCPLTVSH